MHICIKKMPGVGSIAMKSIRTNSVRKEIGSYIFYYLSLEFFKNQNDVEFEFIGIFVFFFVNNKQKM